MFVKDLRRVAKSRGGVFAMLIVGVLCGSGSLFAQNPDYVLSFDAGSGPTGGTAVVTTQVTIAPGAMPLQGLSYGVCHDFTEVQPMAVSSAPDLQVVNLGNPPDFNMFAFDPGSPTIAGGLTHGMVVCILQCATLPAGMTTEILEIEYDLIAPAGTSAMVEYCDIDTVTGQPPLDTLVVANGQAIVPVQDSGVIQIGVGGFIRGDTDADGILQIGDGIALLGHLFQGEPEPSCLDAADSNDDGRLDVADAVYHFFFLFGAAPPPPPWPNCGTDPTSDSLDCDSFPAC